MPWVVYWSDTQLAISLVVGYILSRKAAWPTWEIGCQRGCGLGQQWKRRCCLFFSVSNHPFYSNVVFPLIYLIIWSVSSTMFGLLTQCPFWSVSIVDRCHDPPSSYLQDYCFRYVFDPVLLGQFSPWWLKKNIIGCEYDVLHTEQVRHVRHLHVIVCPYTLW